MRLKNEACVECTHKCLQIHGKKEDSSPAVNSFFKVMIGQKFSKVLFLPPKFARLLPDMVNQKAILEDSSGYQWDVTISNVGGSTAFLQGWNVFSFAHNIKVGDFLVFDYIMKSHFVVKIYDNTGCEKKLDSSERSNQRKRRRDDKKTVIDGSCHTIDTSLSNKQGSSSSHMSGLNGRKSEGLNEVNDVEEEPIATQNIDERCKFVSKAENIDETYLMINRDLGTQQGEDRGPIIDLFSFEMWNNSGGGGINKVTGTDERFSQYVDSSIRSQNEVFMIDNKHMSDQCSQEKIEETYGESSKDKEPHHQSSNMIMDVKDEDPEITPETVDSIGVPSGSNETNTWASSKDKEPHHQSFNMIIDEKNEVDPEIKPESVDSVGIPTDSTETDELISCLVTSENQSFLVLPACLPHSCSLGKSRMVMFLRDPDMRLWPVMYHETSSFQVLTSGWKGFCLENRIQPGDKCSFALVEGGHECIYEVRIVRK